MLKFEHEFTGKTVMIWSLTLVMLIESFVSYSFFRNLYDVLTLTLKIKLTNVFTSKFMCRSRREHSKSACFPGKIIQICNNINTWG